VSVILVLGTKRGGGRGPRGRQRRPVRLAASATKLPRPITTIVDEIARPPTVAGSGAACPAVMRVAIAHAYPADDVRKRRRLDPLDREATGEEDGEEHPDDRESRVPRQRAAESLVHDADHREHAQQTRGAQYTQRLSLRWNEERR